jgi:signal transduction histidine kinase
MINWLWGKLHRLLARAPYPPVIQLLGTLFLCALPLSNLDGLGGMQLAWYDARLWWLAGLVGLHVLLLWLVPVRRLHAWAQLLFLVLQCALVALAQLIMPTPLLDYAYLGVVGQAVYLWSVRAWLPFAALVWLTWSGTLMLASSGLLHWLHSNLTLAFPTVCIFVAVVLYARQQRRAEQVQQLLAQMQQRYDALAVPLREVPLYAALEERRRLAQTVGSEIAASLLSAERQVAAAIAQAQTSVARLEAMVAQTRAAATSVITGLREAVAVLRQGEPVMAEQATGAAATVALRDELLSLPAQRLLTWALPLIFVALAVPLVLLQADVAPGTLALGGLCCLLLLVAYTLTQRSRHPLWLNAGLLSQTATVCGLAVLTHTAPLLLGLLLIIWQIAMRLSSLQTVLFVVLLPTPTGLLLFRMLPTLAEGLGYLLLFSVACAAVAWLIGTARQQLRRRQQAEQRLARLRELMAERQQQEANLRALAVMAERTRLAREFHDDLGHQLVLIGLQLQLAEALLDEDPDAVLERLIASRELLRSAWCNVLAAADAQLPISGAQLPVVLDTLARRCEATGGPTVALRLEGSLDTLTPPVALAVYRAVQEGLSNAWKHGKARVVQVTVSKAAGQVSAAICDDGQGASTASVAPPGFGLIGLHERAEQLAGVLEAGPLPQGGFRLHLCVPLESAAS